MFHKLISNFTFVKFYKNILNLKYKVCLYIFSPIHCISSFLEIFRFFIPSWYELRKTDTKFGYELVRESSRNFLALKR